MEYELKRWKEQYLPLLPVYASDPSVSEGILTGFPCPFTPECARAFLDERQLADETKEYARAIIINGEVAGAILIRAGEGTGACCGGLEFWLGEPFRGDGIMSSALRRACAQAFRCLDISRIQAVAAASNGAARGALNNADFTLEGILRKSVVIDGEVSDSCVYALLRDEAETDSGDGE